MRPIDLVKQKTQILPGLEFSLHQLCGEMNQIRKTLDLTPLILVEDPQKLIEHRKAIQREAGRKAARTVKFNRLRTQQREAVERRLKREESRRLKAANKKTLVKRGRA
jgi:hypothetical protein